MSWLFGKWRSNSREHGSGKSPEGVKKPPIQLKAIVTEKHVACLECGKKMPTLKAHIKKAHGFMPKDYSKKFNLDLKNIRSGVRKIRSIGGKSQWNDD